MTNSGPNAGLIALAKLDARLRAVTLFGMPRVFRDQLCETAAEFGLNTTPQTVGVDLAELLAIHNTLAAPGSVGAAHRETAGDAPSGAGPFRPTQPGSGGANESIPPAQAAIAAFREAGRLCQGAKERLQPLRRRR